MLERIRRLAQSQRPYSIRTRIKTAGLESYSNTLTVRDHIPLEQGLRPVIPRQLDSPPSVRDHIPLEQGLRRGITPILVIVSLVRDHIPLEQGLRLGIVFIVKLTGQSETIFH